MEGLWLNCKRSAKPTAKVVPLTAPLSHPSKTIIALVGAPSLVWKDGDKTVLPTTHGLPQSRGLVVFYTTTLSSRALVGENAINKRSRERAKVQSEKCQLR